MIDNSMLWYSNHSIDNKYIKKGENSNDYYSMTFRFDDVRWAYVLKKIAKSKGLKKNIKKYVFESINYQKLQDSIYTEMKQNIDEIKKETFFEINIQDILIEMLTTFKKTRNFHIKCLTINGDKDLNEEGGIDNKWFKILLNALVLHRLVNLSLWNIIIDQDKSELISNAINKRGKLNNKKLFNLDINI